MDLFDNRLHTNDPTKSALEGSTNDGDSDLDVVNFICKMRENGSH